MAMMINEVAKVAAGRHLRLRSSASLLQLLDVARTHSQSVHSNGTLAPAVLGSSVNRFRYFSSSNNQSSNFLCSNKARILLRDLQVNTQDFSRIDDSSNSDALSRLIKEAEEAAEKDFNVDAMKELYYSLVRPELVSRLLIHKHPFEHTFTHWLKYQTHVLTGQKPRFTTAYDVMVHLLGLHKDDWVFYLNYLAHERIAVIEEWVSISFTKHLIYNHGLKDFANIHFHKGESDASWHQQSNTADFSSLIWDDQQVISARTRLGVPDCYSSAQSEAKAALAILNEAKDLGIKNFVLWSDNKAVCGVISGTKHIDPKGKDWKLFMALRSLRPAFKRLVVMSVPRELLKFADGMLREPSVKLLKTTGVKYPRLVQQSAKQWAYHLNGLPVFSLSMTPEANGLMSKFDKPVHGEPLAKKFYVEAEVDQKMSALQNLMSVLKPAKVYVATQELEAIPKDVLDQLYDLMGNKIAMKSHLWSILCSESTIDDPKGTVMVVLDGWSSELEKCLPVTDMTILLATSEDVKSLINQQIPELSASAFIFYHGPCLPT